MESSQSNTENELLLRVAEGDEQAFAGLFRIHHQALGAYIFKLTGSKESAEEITQDAFMKAWQQREKLGALTSFRAWLFTISRNQAFNALRDHSRQLLKHHEWVNHQDVAVEGRSKADEGYLQQVLAKAVAQLPTQQQRAYLLSREQGMKHAQIAETMQISQETVKRHISLALSAILQYLRVHYPDLMVIFLLSLYR